MSFKQLWLSVAKEVLEVTKDGGAKVPFLMTRASVEVCLMSGICSITEQCAKMTEIAPEVWDKWLEDKFKQWPKFSGDIDYPVPSDTKDSAKMAYFFCSPTDLWSPFCPYGALRRELLEFLIREVEKECDALFTQPPYDFFKYESKEWRTTVEGTWTVGGVDVHP